MKKYTLKELKRKPTKAQDLTADLKVETRNARVWLTRTTVEHGEPYNNKVVIEERIDEKWVITDTYQAL